MLRSWLVCRYDGGLFLSLWEGMVLGGSFYFETSTYGNLRTLYAHGRKARLYKPIDSPRRGPSKSDGPIKVALPLASFLPYVA